MRLRRGCLDKDTSGLRFDGHGDKFHLGVELQLIGPRLGRVVYREV
jgi:hypothetical protein